MKKLLLIAAVLFAGSLSLEAQGACNIQGLACAGDFVSLQSANPTLRAEGAACLLTDPGTSYAGQFGGAYHDFTTNADGTLNWASYQVPFQSLYAMDFCYKPCDSSVDVSAAGCPSLTGEISAAQQLWINPTYTIDGRNSIVGETPDFQYGGQSCSSATLYGVGVTLCVSSPGAVVLGQPTGAPGAGGTAGTAQHCALIYASSAPPTCVCGYQPACVNNTWACPNNNSDATTDTYYAYAECYIYGVQDPCNCTYLVTDYLSCGSVIEETFQLIEYDCVS